MATTRTTGASGKRLAVTDYRLSALPDCLLHAIMSFLTARQAVQTCLLSRRWEDLWCSMPFVDIDQRDFISSAMDSESASVEVVEDNGFEDFVSNLLMFHRAPLLNRFRYRGSRFHFHGCYAQERKVIDRWINCGIKRCPTVLEIDSGRGLYSLPHLGSSSSRLKRLHLSGVAVDESFTRQLPNVLEDLELYSCVLGNPEITSCKLKTLILRDCSTGFGNVLTIKAPALAYLQLAITVAGWNWKGIIVHEMPALVKATICLKSQRSTGNILRDEECKLLCSLICVRDLTLCGSQTLAILHDGSDTFPVFHNLRTLLLDRCDLSDNFQILGCFLNSAPSLEKLTLQYCQLPQGSRKRKTRENPKRISLKCQDTKF